MKKKFCDKCGYLGETESRKYSDDSGYDSPSRWANEYEIFCCQNCGFFNTINLLERDCTYAGREEWDEMPHQGPQYDPDYKNWVEESENFMKIKEVELTRNRGKRPWNTKEYHSYYA